MGSRSLSLADDFDKYEGLGNDFIVVEVDDEDAADRETALRLCDRRTGVGADGVLLLLPARNDGAAVRMRVINADGSVPEICGNGLRCVALHLATRRGLSNPVVETDAGLRACAIESDASSVSITVAMGRVLVEGPRTIVVDGEPLEVWFATAGNPHAVIFGVFGREVVNRLGPRIATHSAFSGGANVGFATAGGREGGIDLVVWERGVGLTLACGTGACAAVAVGAVRGLLPVGGPIDVRLPGGTLSVTRDPRTEETSIRGPARHVFRGQLHRTR